MSTIQFFIRLLVAALIVGAGVLFWALGPYLQGVHDPNSDVRLSVEWLSIFFGTAKPTGYTALLLLLSRAMLALSLAAWVFLPGLRFFADADFSAMTRGIVLLLLTVCVASFFGALVVHWLVYS